MRTIKIFVAVCLMLTTATVFAQDESKDRGTVVLGSEIKPWWAPLDSRLTNRLIAPKGGVQCGVSMMYADFSTMNSEYMLVLNGLNASASMMRIAPEILYTYMHNHAVGIRGHYTYVTGMMDSITADLLGNLSLGADNINAMSKSIGGSLFHRTYIGFDKHGRLGMFWDYVLGYSNSTTQFYTGEQSDAYSLNNKISLSFAPGIVFFPMNNVSVQACISVGGLSYNDVTAYDGEEVTGTRRAWKVYAGLSLLDLNFGLTVHL